jgi:hypothetical protein
MPESLSWGPVPCQLDNTFVTLFEAAAVEIAGSGQRRLGSHGKTPAFGGSVPRCWHFTMLRANEETFYLNQLWVVQSRPNKASKRPNLRYTEIETIPKKVRGMVIIYLLAVLIGGLVSCALLWPYGAAIALLGIPFGGSLLALFVAVLVYMRVPSKAASNNNRAIDTDRHEKLQPTESRH